MKPIRIVAMAADYQSSKLQMRMAAFNAASSAWGAERERIDVRLTTANANPSYFTNPSGERIANGPESWITAATFADGPAIVAAADELRRRRLTLPVEGLRLLDELDGLRTSAQAEWKVHAEGLKDRLQKAIDAAAKEAASFTGLSASARARHIDDQTAVEQMAASVANPCPENWYGWDPLKLNSNRDALVEELRAVFARYA